MTTESSLELIIAFKAQLAGDTSSEFLPKLRSVLEMLTVYDLVTMELEASRQNSVTISELRERLGVALSVFELQLRAFTDPADELKAWSQCLGGSSQSSEQAAKF